MNPPASEFQVTCECGKSTTVYEWSAGTQWTCDCGRLVTVPSLGKLRQSVGLSEVPRSPAEIVRTKVQDQSLPVCGCLLCGSSNAETVPLIAICEQETTYQSSSSDQASFALFGVLGGILFDRQRNRETRTIGRNVSVAVPIQLCDVCVPMLPNPMLSKIATIAKYLFGLAGVMCLFVTGWGWLALVFLPLAIASYVLERLFRWWHFSNFRKFLSPVPEYRELFRQYPAANIGLYSPKLLEEQW